MLSKRINEDFQRALTDQDRDRLFVLRLLKSALHNEEIALKTKGKELTDEQVIAVIQREAKKRKEAKEMYDKADRQELANQEEKELAVLSAYLPEQMPEEELRKAVRETIEQTGATGPQDFGRVMGQVMGQVKGRADGQQVSRLVKEELEN